MQTTLESLASQASHLIGDVFDAAMPLINKDAKKLPGVTHFVAAQLFLDCHLSSESTLLLINLGKQWDAELITRSVLEGSLKLAYILEGTKKEIEEKSIEFWEVLPLFYSIRHSEKAKQILEAATDANSQELAPFREMSLASEALDEIRSKYSKAERRIIEEKWSFVGLCRSLAKSNDPHSNKIVGLAHGYAMSSHLLHKDADGIGMVWDRAQRSDKRRDAVTSGHSARIISDICAFSKLRLLSVLKACGGSLDEIKKIEKSYSNLNSDLDLIFKNFYDVEYGVERHY
jgi:hypothetical protein